MRYVLSENTVRRLGEMSKQLDSLVPRNVPVASRPYSENVGATPYNFAVVSYYQSGGWWAEVCNGKPWDLAGLAGAGEIRIHQLNGTDLTITALPKAFALVSGNRIYARIWYSGTGGGNSSGSLEQASGAWPILVSGLSSGTLISWPLAIVDSGTGEVTQKHVGDIIIPSMSAAGGGICVQITSQVDYQHYLCSVYGNGYRGDTGTPVAATETGQALWIDQIAAGTTIPTGTRLRATKIGAHYEADVPRWL